MADLLSGVSYEQSFELMEIENHQEISYETKFRENFQRFEKLLGI